MSQQMNTDEYLASAPNASESLTTAPQLPMTVCFVADPYASEAEIANYEVGTVVVAEFTSAQPFLELKSEFPAMKSATANFSENPRERDENLRIVLTHVVRWGNYDDKPVLEMLDDLDKSLDKLFLYRKSDQMMATLYDSAEPRQATLYKQIKNRFIKTRLERIHKNEQRIEKYKATESEKLANLALEILNISWEYNRPYSTVLEVFRNGPYKKQIWLKKITDADSKLEETLEKIDLEARRYAELTTFTLDNSVFVDGTKRLKVTLPHYKAADSLTRSFNLWKQPYYDDRFAKLIGRYIVTNRPEHRDNVYRLIYALTKLPVRPKFMIRDEFVK